MHPCPFEISMQTRTDRLIARVGAFATAGSGDVFRLFRDSAVLSKRDTPLPLRRQGGTPI
jgi:hypothetical protein